MPVSAALRRLLRVRNLEEEQQRLALESALSGLHALERALELALAAERRGRGRLASSISAADPAGRVAGLVESSSAVRHAAALRPRILVAEQETARLRSQYVEKRAERLQAETLIREREALDAKDAERRMQQGLDNWISTRGQRDKLSLKRRSTRPPVEKH